MERLDEIMARVLPGLRAMIVKEEGRVASNDDAPVDPARTAKFVAIARELNESARKRRNRKRRRVKAG